MKSRRAPTLMMAVFTATSLFGATLLFAVQPMAAKMLLPSYGGSPMVWNTAMLFFQTALLAGYGFAHWSPRRLGTSWQPLVHIVIVALPLALLPFGLPTWAVAPDSAQPALWLLLVLVVMVGAPFAVLATTSPIVQHWYARSNLPRSHDPYFLFAASNAGSMLALLAYPFLIEPAADVRVQARWWAIGYAVFAVFMVASGLFVRFAGPGSTGLPVAGAGRGTPVPGSVRPGAGPDDGGPDDGESGDVGPESARPGDGVPGAGAETDIEAGSAPAPGIGWRRRLGWLGLAFIPSSLMLGVTTHISTDIAPVPLLWVVPLALYLLTFIVAFAGGEHRWLKPTILVAGALAVVLPVGLLVVTSQASQAVALPMDFTLLTVAGLACHGILARDRPDTGRLTEFYLVLSIGGALGGLFNGLLAPVVFDWVAEFPLVIAALAVLPLATRMEAPLARRLGRARIPVSMATLIIGPVLIGMSIYQWSDQSRVPGLIVIILWTVAITLVFHPKLMCVMAVALTLVLFLVMESVTEFKERTFFGSSRVISAEGRKTFIHGNTVHGIQLTDPAQRRTPTAYYVRTGPIGDIFATYGARPGSERVAVVGLGAGGLATYGRAGQRMDFYEIDPAVVDIARDARHFSYLRDCPCQATTIVGDGRLRLAEMPDAAYGMIVLDAFSSDAVPTHLLTREAIQLYGRKLRPGGVLVFNVTNRHLDLAPMLGATAAANGLAAVTATYDPKAQRPAPPHAFASRWVVLGRSESDLRPLRDKGARWKVVPGGGPVWTDAYSSLFGVLNFAGR